MTIFRYAMIKGLQGKLTLICNCILPLALIFLRPLWTGDFQLGFSIMAFAIMSGTFLISQGIMEDRVDNTITRILAAPVTMFNYLVQKLLAYIVPITVVIIMVCLIGFALYDWTFSFTIALMLCYNVFAIASVALTFAWVCLFKSKETSMGTFSMFLTAMAVIGGLLIPVEVLPTAIRYIGAFSPSYWASTGIGSLLLDGVTLRYWLSIAIMAMFTVIFLLYGGKRRIV
ncbi:MAG: ABC transporter permease [Defluviitaleaceae bacterium]|nr:ABC transporter permease [Defluviitaleaceae bacterium]